MKVEDVVKRVNELGVERGDFVYREQEGASKSLRTMCSYVGARIGKPGIGSPCIIGQALQDLGVPMEALIEFEEMDAAVVVSAFTEDSDGKGLNYLGYVQASQDDGDSWAEAIATGIKRMENYNEG